MRYAWKNVIRYLFLRDKVFVNYSYRVVDLLSFAIVGSEIFVLQKFSWHFCEFSLEHQGTMFAFQGVFYFIRYWSFAWTYTF